MKRQFALICLSLLSVASACAGNPADGGGSSPSGNEGSSQAGDDGKGDVSLSSIAGDATLTPNCLKKLSTLDEVKAKENVYIVAKDGTNYYGYTGEPKENLEYYHLGECLTAIDGHSDLFEIPSESVEVALSFEGDAVSVQVGTFYLWSGTVESDGKTYANIGLKDEATYFTLEDLGDGEFRLGNDGAYLEYYKGSFSAAKEKYKDDAKISFYAEAYEDLTPEEGEDDSQGETGGDVTKPENNDYWSTLDLDKRGNAFRAELKSLISSYRTTTCSYSACLSIGAAAAAYPSGAKTFVPFYHAPTGTSEGITSSNGIQVVSGGCNREHTWPRSRGAGNSGPGADPFIIRPTISTENSSRGNDFYGNSASNEWDPASCGYEYARGEAARVTLYAATAYYGTSGLSGAAMELSNNPSDDASKHTMGTLKTILEWNATYPVTAMERQINDYLCSHGYGRNPFVDEPSYANLIWNAKGLIA